MPTKRRNSTKTLYTLYHLDSERGLRGGERQLLYLAAYLRAQGHENIVVCRKGSELEHEAAKQGFATLTLPFISEWDPISALKLRIASRRAKNPPIFHAHTGHTAALACLASRLKGPPTVVHRRVDFAVSKLSARFKYGRASAAVSVSKSIQDILEGAGVPSGKLTVIPDCLPISPEEASEAGLQAPLGPAPAETRSKIREQIAAKWGARTSYFWIGNMAALVPHKDQETFLRSMADVQRSVGHARFFIIGQGPLGTSLKSLAKSLGISEFVYFVGHQANPLQWLQALDLFVLSSWGEGMGSVLLEAMACRLPIVATTAGGIPEVVQNFSSGLLVPPREPEQLAKAIIDAIKKPSETKKMVEEGVKRLANFSLNRCGASMEETYARIIGNGRP